MAGLKKARRLKEKRKLERAPKVAAVEVAPQVTAPATFQSATAGLPPVTPTDLPVKPWWEQS